MEYEIIKIISKNEKLILNITKILIICFISYSILGSIEPFYEGRDSYTHALASINFSQGELERTNSLLDETGQKEFAGDRWLVTDSNSAVPRIPGSGISFFGGISFLLGGYYGLFYLTPIFTIILLVVVERVSTKTFGSYVGLFTLLVVGTSNLLFRNSLSLQTETMFSVFFILASFYFINYLRRKNNLYLFLASCLFVSSSAIRLQGVVSFPIEIAIVAGLFTFHIIQRKRISSSHTQNTILLHKSELLKALIFISIPWIIFFIGYMSFFDTYFGDPLTNSSEIAGSPSYEASSSSLTTVKSEDLDNVKQYSKYLLPYQIPATFDKSDNNFENILGNNWIGIISILILILSFAFALRIKKHRLEMILFLALIFATVWFYASITSEDRASYGVPGRYMIPVFILSTMIFGFTLKEFFKLKLNNRNKTFISIIKGIKIFIFGIICLFLITAFYFSVPSQILINDGLSFNDPSKLASKYPLQMEGLTSDSVIMAFHTDWVIDYGVIPLQVNTANIDNASQLLKKVLEDGYDVYTFKQTTYPGEKDVFKLLLKNNEIVLKEYSPTFCKIMLNENNSMENDGVCLIK